MRTVTTMHTYMYMAMLAISGMAMLSEENLQQLSPSAAAASKLLKSGLTLTQIYSQYVDVSTRLQLEEAENKRLGDCLATIMEEIEAKAPVLKQQRDDYERCLESVDLLTQQLDTAVRVRPWLCLWT